MLGCRGKSSSGMVYQGDSVEPFRFRTMVPGETANGVGLMRSSY